MSFPPDLSESPAMTGLFAGAVAYLVGLAVIVGARFAGIHPATGVWDRSADGIGSLLVHQAAHLPVWQFTIQWAMIPYTGILAGVLVLAGFVVTRRGRSQDGARFRTGSSVALGYVSLTLVGSALLVVSHGAVTPIRMVAPTLLVGGFFPALFGCLGGMLSESDNRWVDET